MSDETKRPRASAAVASTTVDRPDRVPQYTLVRLLGSGGFGAVYEAHDNTPLRARRAVKILEPLPFPDLEDGRRRFVREAEAIVRLAHRAVVPLIGVDFTTDGLPALIMDFIEGERLAVAASAMSMDQRVSAIAEVLTALQHAHEKGVYHRDVKPSNIMIRTADRQVILVDFGTAYVFDAASSNTLTTQAAGSSGYIPPEVQADPKIRRATHDVYSCGVTLYELLAGHRPNPAAFRSLTEVDPTLGALDVIVQKALRAEEIRYASCGAFAADLERWLAAQRLSQGTARSVRTDTLRAQLLASRQSSDRHRDLESAKRQGLSDAIAQVQVLVEGAAEAGFRELSALLAETHGYECVVETPHSQPDRTGLTPLLVLRTSALPSTSVVIARTSAFAEPLGRPGKVLHWPDPRGLQAMRQQLPPDQYQGPFWVIYDDRGGYRSPSRVLRGGIAAYVSHIETSTWTPTMTLHAGNGSAIPHIPVVLKTGDDVRDFWLERGTAIFTQPF